MTLRAYFRRPARLEYDEAASWYDARRHGLGQDFVAAVDHAVRNACEFPQRYPLALADVRCVRVRQFPYVVYFRVRADRAIVLSVFHARRDPAVWQARA